MMLVRVSAVVALVVVLLPVPAAAQLDCPVTLGLEVPGAEFTQATCLPDLTSLSNPRMDTFTHSWGGSGNRANPALNSTLTEYPADPVPGVQIEGWFPDSCSRYEIEHNTFIPPCPDGHRHNGQFLIRVPNDWDGVHLVVASAPGVRTQFANDLIISDFVLARGWAYAAHDKGNTGINFFRAGDDETGGDPLRWVPPEAIAQWPRFMELTALGAQGVLQQLHGREAERTYAAGISNGGYQVRLALERYPETFDAGLDWEGTLFSEANNVLTYVPPLLQGYPTYRATGDPEGYRLVVHEGQMPPDSEPIWNDMYTIYWGAVATTYRPVVDPEYSNYLDAPQLVVPPVHPDAQYDYRGRPQVVHDRMAQLSNTGNIHGRPLITLHGTLDALLPIGADSDRYAELVRAEGYDASYRYYVVEGGTHIDGAADDFPDLFRPILPCFLEALDALDTWVGGGAAAPPSGFVPFPADQTPTDRANTCGLPGRVDRVAGADRLQTAALASRRTFGVTRNVVLATAGDFPDALAATPLAASLDAPLLLVGQELGPDALRELDRTGATDAYLVGGIGVLPEAIADALRALGLEVTRLAGPDRYATAAAVASEVRAPGGLAFIASGERFPDALAAGPVAAARRAPILLTPRDALPNPTLGVLAQLGIGDAVVVGGSNAVADAVLGGLPSPERVAGPDRFATAVALAEHGLAHGLTPDEVYLASGAGFADALAAGPTAAAGEWGAQPRGPLLLLGQDTAASTTTLEWLRDHATLVERALLFGGSAAIDPAVEAAVVAALG